ncbi:hypothetical protein XENOCAPTIV_027694 [Xenoophorus captivus]|uniref:Uncharacterized protein n=1 Tax=Xenoophorus captivus TaxID=1517983 RepID=A0ABV0QNB0_9TELE
MSRFQPPKSTLGAELLFVSVRRCCHTRRSAVELSSCASARSLEADWASSLMSVVGVGGAMLRVCRTEGPGMSAAFRLKVQLAVHQIRQKQHHIFLLHLLQEVEKDA